MDYIFRGTSIDKADNLNVRIFHLIEAQWNFALNMLDGIEKHDMG